MSSRIASRIASALATTSLAVGIALASGGIAHAASVHQVDNVARAFCADVHVKVSCIADADDDTGRFAVRTVSGRFLVLHSTASIARYLKRHAPACLQEDSVKCYWNASLSGNHVGESFVTVGSHRGPKGTPQHAVRGVVLYVGLYGN